MEQVLIWLSVSSLIIIVFFIYFRKFRNEQKLALERKQEAQSLGIDRPNAQFPMIDASLCIGCGSCVTACPEGDVLGVVWGVATIINGKRCVGHGHCETMCPVGALKVGMGDVLTRPDIPILTEECETTVPGLYIAGELGGISLIHNAVNQGRNVIKTIAEKQLDESKNSNIMDVIIIGAGPAGLSAALAAIENNLSYLVIEQNDIGGSILSFPRRKLVMTQPMELPLYGTLNKNEYRKEFLLELWQELIEKFNIQINCQEKMNTISRNENHFDIITTKGVYQAKSVVLGLGRRGTPRQLNVEGEKSAKVSYKLIDAQSYNNKDILIVGGGDSAVEAAVGLARQKKNKVTISYRKSKFFRIKKKNEDNINSMIRSGNINPIFNSNIKKINEDSIVIDSETEVSEIKNDFVFIFAGGIPPFNQLKEMGITFGGEQTALPKLEKQGV